MYSSRTGQCRSFNEQNSLAAPFVKRSCFEPCFLTPMNDSNSDEPYPSYNAEYNITNNDRSCGFNSNYNGLPSGTKPVQFSGWDSRNSIYRRENSRVVGYAQRDYKTPNGQTCPQQPLIVLDETDTPKVICPILTSLSVQPQCNTCLLTCFACERFKEIDPIAYQKCNFYKRMIHYNIVTPNGSFIPLGVEMTDEGFETYKSAAQKCSVACGSCRSFPSQENKQPPGQKQCKGEPY